tara:strand:+ start:17086 stop:18294 length:1209 start_codon:yes stop_codon:yes gene_type:complete
MKVIPEKKSTEKKCELCGSDCNVLADLGNQPLANKYPANKDAFKKEKFWHLKALICSNCFCGQLNEMIDRSEMFEDYYYLSSVNAELNKHFDDFAKDLLDFNFVLDVGSNDGILLRPLKNNNVKCLGIDPSINVGEIANNEGLETIVDFFNMDSAKYIKDNYGKPDAIVASSIFTHLEKPKDFIESLEYLISNNGEIFIEIEYLLNLVKKCQFERFYFDRPFYYSVTSMKNIFEENNLVLTNVKEISPHGGSLRLSFMKRDHNLKIDDSVKNFLELERNFFKSSNVNDFQKEIEKNAKDLVDLLNKDNLTIAGYGAPARLATITNFANIDINKIKYVVDDSPLKAGRYSPGMHIPIVNKDYLLKEKPDLLVVFAYEYIESIFEYTKQLGIPHYQPIPPKQIK